MSTKLHVSPGEAGLVSCCLSPGQQQDGKAIDMLWKSWSWQSIQAVVGDKGYASSAIRTEIRSHGARAVIPRK